jgi:hypothetical protein
MSDKELFSWSKFFSGIVSPLGFFKTLAGIFRVCLIVLVLFGGYLLGVRIHNWLTPKKPNPVVFTVADQVGGEVRNSADQKQTKFGLFNF